MATAQYIRIPCDHCATEIKRTPKEMARRKLHFCNRTCQAKGIGERQRGADNPAFNSAEMPCDFCGKVLLIPLREQSRSVNHFCDLWCRSKWRSIHYRGANNPAYNGGIRLENCEECFTLCRRSNSKMQRNGNRAFCSNRCYAIWRSREIVGEKHPRWNGGKIPYYGPNWQRQRRATRKRDGYTCRACPITEELLGRSLDVHHVVPFRQFDYVQGKNDNYKSANSLRNLLALCPDCHPKMETGRLSLLN